MRSALHPIHRLHQFCSATFTYLLLALLLLFIFRPYNVGFGYLAGWELCLAFVFIGAVFNCNHPRNVKIAAVILGIPALVIEWVTIFHHIDYVVVTGITLTILFLLLVTISLVYNEVLRAPPTLGSLRPVLCAYFMFGFAFSYIFLLVEYLSPGSLQLIVTDITSFYHGPYLSEVIYYSFGNLTTVGASNIAALLPNSQSVVIIEAIVGQFYIAVLVAKIVTLYAAHDAGKTG